MGIIRGSTHKLVAIKEVTYGTTPATPVMLETPIVSMSKTSNRSALQSAQLRSHPFLDKMLSGAFSHEIGIDFELQDDNHDHLLDSIFGDTWTANVIKVKDVLKGLTLESQAGTGIALFDQFSGTYLNKLDLSVGSGDNAPIKLTASGMAKNGTLDATTTLASSVTAAASKDPMVFTEASLTIATVSRPVTAFSFSLDRTVDPLNVIGTTTPREYVAAGVSLTGSVTVAYEDATDAALFTSFADAALALNCSNVGATETRNWAIPKTKFTRIGRPIQGRGGILQELAWTAIYDSVSASVMSLTRSA